MADRTVQINSFKYGLDTRREALASLPGTLQTAQNVVIDSGGEIEKRKGFFPVDSANIQLPVGCFGLQDTDSGLMTFGSGTSPAGLPTGVVYQQLIAPYTFGNMTAVRYSCSFLGKAFVIALFGGPGEYVFYDGTLVGQITDGFVKLTAPNTSETITQLSVDLAAIVNVINGWLADANVTAIPYDGVHFLLGYQESALAGSTLVMSPPGVHFTPTITNNNSVLGVLGVKLVDQNYPGVAAQAATVAFTLNTGTNGTVTITAPAKADGTGTAAVSGGAVNFHTSLGVTATDVVTAINSNTFLTGYTAAVTGTTITVFAPTEFGAFQLITPHDLIVDTTGDITAVAGVPQSYLALTVKIGPETIPYTFPGDPDHVGYRTLTPSVTGAFGTVTYTWAQVTSANVDLPNPTQPFGLSAVVGANVSAIGAVASKQTITGRFRCTATDAGTGKFVTVYFTLQMV